MFQSSTDNLPLKSFLLIPNNIFQHIPQRVSFIFNNKCSRAFTGIIVTSQLKIIQICFYSSYQDVNIQILFTSDYLLITSAIFGIFVATRTFYSVCLRFCCALVTNPTQCDGEKIDVPPSSLRWIRLTESLQDKTFQQIKKLIFSPFSTVNFQ